MRMLAVHNYLPISVIDAIDTKRLRSELKPLGYSLGRISGPAAAGNGRVWLYGPNSTANDEEAHGLLIAQATRRRITL